MNEIVIHKKTNDIKVIEVSYFCGVWEVKVGSRPIHKLGEKSFRLFMNVWNQRLAKSDLILQNPSSILAD